MDKQQDTFTVVRVINFKKLNPRKDIKKSHWFRLSHDLFGRPDTADFTPTNIACWIYILSMSSRDHTDITRILHRHCTMIARIKIKDLRESLEKFQRNGWVEILPRNAHVSLQDRTKQDRTKQDSPPLPLPTQKPEPPQKPVEKKQAPHTPVRLVGIWNSTVKKLSQVSMVYGPRLELAEKAWRERPDEGFWVKAFLRADKSTFLTGGGPRGWRAPFDFFLKPENLAKVLEGAYDDAGKTETNWDRVFGTEKANATK
jgi:hypothetical protein